MSCHDTVIQIFHHGTITLRLTLALQIINQLLGLELLNIKKVCLDTVYGLLWIRAHYYLFNGKMEIRVFS